MRDCCGDGLLESPEQPSNANGEAHLGWCHITKQSWYQGLQGTISTGSVRIFLPISEERASIIDLNNSN